MNPFNALRRKPEDEMNLPKIAEMPAIAPQVQAVLTQFAALSEQRNRAIEERDKIEAAYNTLKEKCEQVIDQAKKDRRYIEQLEEEFANYKSRTTVYQLERDEAVTKCANATAELNNVMKQLKAIVGHNPEPIAPDAENSIPALDYKVPPVNLGTTANTSAPRPPSLDEMVARINGK